MSKDKTAGKTKARFNEDTRVKIPATIQFLRSGYEYQSQKDAEIDRETRIFINRFKPAVEKLNGIKLSDEQLSNLLGEVNSVLKNNDMGKAFYKWLRNPNPGQLKLIDLDNIANNDFAVVNELVFGPENAGSFRPDINVLVNGIPLAFLEVKKPNNEGGIQAEFKRMLDRRLEIPAYKKYFNMIQVTAFSNNMEYEEDDDAMDPQDVRAGSFYTTPNGFNTTFSFFRDEQPKKDGFTEISDEMIKYVLKDNGYSPIHFNEAEFHTNLDMNTPANRFVTSLFDKERFMYFLKYGINYVDSAVPQKHIMRYPQFFASKAIVKRLESGGKSGIIFHTQGSGKTGLAAFSTSILKDYYAAKGITARFYYVVDRLDLLNQVSADMKKRGLTVRNVNSKKEFEQELNRAIPMSGKDSTGEITVVNIQKFDSDMPVADNAYNAKIQRIFVVDEAHRSYALNGEFFKNLMLVDRDAVFLALTGTPLLSKKERSNLKFGDYIHKYFYDKSIADGYTLRIKKETIETGERAKIRQNLDLENPHADTNKIKETEDYIRALGKFIDKDFNNFRLTNNDKTIGAMVVCCSNLQAKKIKRWFDDNSKFSAGLVISDDDIPSAQNKNTQISFKEENQPDILIVHQMLTTGYDVPRLKKMYLLRNAKEHTLLQTISRVNRPYRSPNGNVYKYGYITDFVDIEKEYDRTIEMYLKEMADGMEEEGVSGGLSGLVIGPEDINKKYLKYKKELEGMVDTANVERFSQELTSKSKEQLLTIRRLLNGIRDCYREFLLSRADEYASQIDEDHIKKLIKEVQNRINFVNLKSKPTDFMNIISNKEVVEILYEFVKTKISLFDLSRLNELFQKFTKSAQFKDMKETVEDIQKEIKKNVNLEQSEIIKLDEFLKKIFEKLEIQDFSDWESLNADLKEALERIRKINEENERLARRYNGNYAFVKTYTDTLEQHPELDKEDIASVLDVVYDKTKGLENSNLLIIQGRGSYVGAVKKSTMAQLIKTGLYKKLNLKEWYEELINAVYTNVEKF